MEIALKGRRALVFFNASLVSGYVSGEMVHWGACKAALFGLSRGLAESVAGTGVTVNAFMPGPTHTEESFMRRAQEHLRPGKTFAAIQQELFDGPLATSVLKRFIDPAELANVIVFLSSDAASAMTGVTIRIDGGITRYPI